MPGTQASAESFAAMESESQAGALSHRDSMACSPSQGHGAGRARSDSDGQQTPSLGRRQTRDSGLSGDQPELNPVPSGQSAAEFELE